MDFLDITLIVILAIAIVEGVYILVKTQRKKQMDESSPEEYLLRIHILDAIRLGFGFMIGSFIFLLVLFIFLIVLQALRIPLPSLPFFLSAP